MRLPSVDGIERGERLAAVVADVTRPTPQGWRICRELARQVGQGPRLGYYRRRTAVARLERARAEHPWIRGERLRQAGRRLGAVDDQQVERGRRLIRQGRPIDATRQ